MLTNFSVAVLLCIVFMRCIWNAFYRFLTVFLNNVAALKLALACAPSVRPLLDSAR